MSIARLFAAAAAAASMKALSASALENFGSNWDQPPHFMEGEKMFWSGRVTCTSHVTRHTSHVTRHTSHVTRHKTRVTRHLEQSQRAERSPFDLALDTAASVTSHHPKAASTMAAAAAAADSPDAYLVERNTTPRRH